MGRVNMKMREKSFVILTCFPCFILVFFAVKFANDFLLLLALILTVIFAFAGGLVYDRFILDSQSTSFLYAGYEAVKKGYDPKSQNGIYCKPENYTISEVYESFPANRNSMPIKNTAGLMFTTYAKGKKSNKVEFYMYNTNDAEFLYWQFFFDVYETKRDFIKEKRMSLSEISRNKVFVVLEPKRTIHYDAH